MIVNFHLTSPTGEAYADTALLNRQITLNGFGINQRAKLDIRANIEERRYFLMAYQGRRSKRRILSKASQEDAVRKLVSEHGTSYVLQHYNWSRALVDKVNHDLMREETEFRRPMD